MAKFSNLCPPSCRLLCRFFGGKRPKQQKLPVRGEYNKVSDIIIKIFFPRRAHKSQAKVIGERNKSFASAVPILLGGKGPLNSLIKCYSLYSFDGRVAHEKRVIKINYRNSGWRAFLCQNLAPAIFYAIFIFVEEFHFRRESGAEGENFCGVEMLLLQ